MDRRQQSRVSAAIPVRVWGVSSKGHAFQQNARAYNLSNNGMLLEGFNQPVNPGHTIQVQYGDETASFAVVWAGWPGSRRCGQIGLCKLPSEPSLWHEFKLQNCVMYGAKG